MCPYNEYIIKIFDINGYFVKNKRKKTINKKKMTFLSLFVFVVSAILWSRKRTTRPSLRHQKASAAAACEENMGRLFF